LCLDSRQKRSGMTNCETILTVIEGGEVMAIQPLADRIVVKVLEAKEVTKGGILLPDTAKKNPRRQSGCRG